MTRTIKAAVALIALGAGYSAFPQGVPFWPSFQAIAGPRAVDRAAQIRAESGFNPNAANAIGAKGLGQAMPATWADYIRRGWVPAGSSPFDPLPALQGQHAYMCYLEGRCSGDFTAALASYNAGLGSVRKAQALASALGMPDTRAWLRALPRVTGPHAAETQTYVQRIETIHLPWVKAHASGSR